MLCKLGCFTFLVSTHGLTLVADTGFHQSCPNVNLPDGLVMTGQGGSGTRAAQEMVAMLGTYEFGRIDNETHDSLAVRDGFGFDTRNDIMREMGSVAYDARDLPWPLYSRTRENICKSLEILDSDRKASGNEGVPWAVKEPWLRVVLPVLEEAAEFKLVHVTRDVRHIHDTHGDEDWTDYIDEIASYADVLSNQSSSGFNRSSLQKSLESARRVASSGVDELATTRWVKFAHVWAFMELSIHYSWKARKPLKYLHISPAQIADDPYKAHQLVQFLGKTDPDEKLIDSIMSVYDPSIGSQHDKHYSELDRITKMEGGEQIREALLAFGYEE
jgi:hypothetical protein